MKHDIDYVIPGFSDPKKQPAILKQLSEYAQTMGFKPQEIQNLRDRRLLLLAYKAMVLDRMVESKTKGGQ